MADDYPVDLSSRSFLFAFVSICKMAKIRLQGASSKITFSVADFGGSLSVCLFYHFNIDFFLDSLMVRWSPGHHGFQCIFFALPWHRGRMVVYTISGVAITLLIYFRDKCICYMLKQRKLFVFRWWSACRLYANARG